MRSNFAAELAAAESQLETQLMDAVQTLAWVETAVRSPTKQNAVTLAADARRLRQASRGTDLQLVMLMACQAPVACDLRLVLAMIQIAQHSALIANQFDLIAEQLAEVRPGVADRHGTGAMLASMVTLAAEQVSHAAVAFVERDLALARRLEPEDDRIDRLNRKICRAYLDVEAPAQRELALRHVLIARSLERIGDNAVRIAAETTTLVTADVHRLTPAMPRSLSA